MSSSEYYELCNYEQLFASITKSGLRNLKFHRKFKENSVQSCVGVLKYMEPLIFPSIDVPIKNARDFILNNQTLDQNLVLYKVGKVSPFLNKHEYLVAVSLLRVSSFLPNYMRPYELFLNIPTNIANDNPFQTRQGCKEDVGVYEYINAVTNLDSVLEKKKYLERKAIKSLINQTLLAILITQTKLDFCHNDLHFENILVCKCLKNTYMIYIFEYNEVIYYALIPTYGYYPVIVDYGFSYTKDIDRLYAGIHHDHKGYMNHCYDKFVDFKTVLCRLAYLGYPSNDFKKKIDSTINNVLPVDRSTGWDEVKGKSVGYKLTRYLDKFTNELDDEHFIKKYIYEFCDTIGCLILLPLKEQVSTLDEDFPKFMEEWNKIETWIERGFQKIGILKNIVSYIWDDLQKEEQPNMEAFQKYTLSLMDEYGKYIDLSLLNWTKLYTSIVGLSISFEGLMFIDNEKTMERKKKEYAKLKAKNSLDLYLMIEPFITTSYIIQPDDYFIVFNATTESTHSFVMKDPEMVAKINATSIEERAKLLYELNK